MKITTSFGELILLTNGLIIKGVSGIGGYAFNSWKKITSLVLDTSLISIGSWAFAGCSALLEIDLPDSVTSVAAATFDSASSAKKVTLGAGLTTVGGAAFRYLSSCDEIVCKSTTPPSILSNTFEGLKSTCIFKIPSASLSKYRSASNWSAYAKRMVGY